MHARLGSRVYYIDNGPEDTGVIVDILLDNHPFVVKWDKQEQSRYETRVLELPAFNVRHEFQVNPADENVDCFRGDQLALVSY